MPNIIFYLNTNREVKVSQEDFEKSNFSEVLKDQTITYVDFGTKGFQKYSLVAWGPEEINTPEVPVQ